MEEKWVAVDEAARDTGFRSTGVAYRDHSSNAEVSSLSVRVSAASLITSTMVSEDQVKVYLPTMSRFMSITLREYNFRDGNSPDITFGPIKRGPRTTLILFI